MALEPPAIAHIERLAHKLASGAEAFGFKEIDAICGAIELMTQPGPRLTARDRIALCMRLADRLSALSIYVEYELAEKEAKFVPEDVLPMSAALPGFRARRK